jgi:hypothetical protein
LLALLLGFSFSMAATRWELRQHAFIDEANAIGTAYLRTSLLPEPLRRDVAALLVEYVDVRLAPEAIGPDPAGRARSAGEARRLQSRIWQLAIAAVAIDPRQVTTGLFVPSLNEMIDAHGTLSRPRQPSPAVTHKRCTPSRRAWDRGCMVNTLATSTCRRRPPVARRGPR